MYLSAFHLKRFIKNIHAEKELESRSVGRAHVGGPFTLTTHEDKPFSDKDLLGKWNFVYFGFTNCPDICPAELDKIGSVLTSLGLCSQITSTTARIHHMKYREGLWSTLPARIRLR